MATFVFASAAYAEVEMIKDDKAVIRARHLAENIMNKNE
jgi:hypothetical protein